MSWINLLTTTPAAGASAGVVAAVFPGVASVAGATATTGSAFKPLSGRALCVAAEGVGVVAVPVAVAVRPVVFGGIAAESDVAGAALASAGTMGVDSPSAALASGLGPTGLPFVSATG